MRKDNFNTEIIVDVHPLEKRVAVLEDNKLVELFVERKDRQNIVGNIYKGHVKDVLPGMGAAFVEIGLERTAFLHYSDIVLDFLDVFENDKPRQRLNPNDSSQIGNLLKSGQEIVVQVHKGPIGSKGARLTGQISIPGKYLVLFPNKNKIAISRKIYNQGERSRIRNILSAVKDPNHGLIVRTEAEGCDEDEFKNEYNALAKTWRLTEKQIKYGKEPLCVFEENALENYLIRDLFGEHVDRLVVNDKHFFKSILGYLEDVSPDLIPHVELYKEDSPVFDAWGIEKKIETVFHSRIYHGAHVLLRCFKKQEPGPELINLCCNLAAGYSKAKNSANVPVDYTQIRYVRKPRKSAPGLVIYTNHHSVYATPIDIRAAREQLCIK